MELKVNRVRYDNRHVNEEGDTGILVRAKLDDTFMNVDICYLEPASLLTWLRSHGGDNKLAENLIGILLGHGPLHDREGRERIIAELYGSHPRA